MAPSAPFEPRGAGRAANALAARPTLTTLAADSLIIVDDGVVDGQCTSRQVDAAAVGVGASQAGRTRLAGGAVRPVGSGRPVGGVV